MPTSTASNCRRGGSSAACSADRPLRHQPFRHPWLHRPAPRQIQLRSGHVTHRRKHRRRLSRCRIPADALIIVPVRNTVLFPGVIAPITIGRPKIDRRRPAGGARAAADRHPAAARPRDGRARPDDLYRVGTVANIVRYITGPDGSHHIVCQGVQRMRMLDFLPGTPFPAARVCRSPSRPRPRRRSRPAFSICSGRPSKRSNCCRRRRRN